MKSIFTHVMQDEAELSNGERDDMDEVDAD